MTEQKSEATFNGVPLRALDEQLPRNLRAAHHFTLAEAAHGIAAQEGWHQGAESTLLAQMEQAVHEGQLKVIHPHTNLPYKPETVRNFYELVTPATLDAWFKNQQVTLRWMGAQVGPRNEDNSEQTLNSAKTFKKQRRDLLAPLIEAARKTCAASDDTAAIFTILRTWAEEKPPRAPLFGVTEDGRIQWTDSNSNSQELNKEALAARIKRATKTVVK